MKKSLLIIMSLILATSIFAGCNNNEVKPAGNQSQVTDKPKTEEDKFVEDIKESAKNNTLTEEEMLKIGRTAFKDLNSVYVMKNEEELKKSIKKHFLENEIEIRYDAQKKFLFPGKYKDFVANFETEKVTKVGENGFIYESIVSMEITEVKTNKKQTQKERVTTEFQKDQNGTFKIITINGQIIE